MRVRRFELRLVAIALTAGWTAAAALILLAYRPGGPFDLAVALTMAGPALIALAGVIWPPVARGYGAFEGLVWLGIAALLCLVPSLFEVTDQLRARGAQTLVPSLEAAYPWLLALIATSLFSGIGIARRLRGPTALRRRRLIDGALIGTVLTAIAATLFASAALANEIAIRDRVAAASRFGPTADEEPPLCDSAVSAGPSAQVVGRYWATVDARSIGSIELSGDRVGGDFRWTAYVATDRRLGLAGAARIGADAWWRDPGGSWNIAGIERVSAESLDDDVMRTALTQGNRAAAEDRGVEVVEGARARRCRVAVDGLTFRAAFPQIRWLVGVARLDHWRGQLDYWVFLDGQLGQVAGSINGEATDIADRALQATITVRLIATERDQRMVVYPPK